MSLFHSKVSLAQSERTIHVKFEIESKELSFANDVQLSIIINGQEVQPLMYINGFVMPDFKGAKEADVCFTYKSHRYLFKGIPVTKFETNWVFGIVKNPADHKNKREYYIKFNPKDGGDGTQVTITEQ
jgi:hypothetical protein